MFQNVVCGLLRHPDDKRTIGLLLIKGKNKIAAENSFSGYKNPIGVAEWGQQHTRELSEDMKSSLPTIEEIENAINN